MGKSTICLMVIALWVVLVFAIAMVLTDEEQPQERKKPFEWVVDDSSVSNLVSAQILRRYSSRHSTQHHSGPMRIRSPPWGCTGSDGLQW